MLSTNTPNANSSVACAKKQVAAELFPVDFLDQMPKPGSPEKPGSAEKETGHPPRCRVVNSIRLQALLLPQSWSSLCATQAPTPVISQPWWWQWELVAHCYTEVVQRSCSGGRLYSSAVLTAGEERGVYFLVNPCQLWIAQYKPFYIPQSWDDAVWCYMFSGKNPDQWENISQILNISGGLSPPDME